MTYNAEAFDEYPVKVDGGLPEDDDGELTFLRRPSDEGVIPPPTPASWHVDEWVENVQYESRVNHHKRNLAEDPDVKAAQGLGYILPLPGEIGFSRIDVSRGKDGDEDPPEWAVAPNFSYRDDDYLKDGRTPPETGLDYPTYRVNTRWAVDVPDGYSVLVTTPFFMKPDTYSVVPYVIDPDVGLTWIEVTMLLHDTAIRIRYGDPLVQVIPFKRDALQLDAVVDRRLPSDRDEADS